MDPLHPSVRGRGSGIPVGIPPSLFDTYLRYKQDTRAVVSWFLSQTEFSTSSSPTSSPSCKHHAKNIHHVSIRDLARIATKICKSSVVLPPTIAYQFREMIRARHLMSSFFRKMESEKDGRRAGIIGTKTTEDHEFFTTSLAKIYDDLCACCAEKVQDCECDDSCTSDAGGYGNKFIVLNAKIEDDPEEPDGESEGTDRCFSDCSDNELGSESRESGAEENSGGAATKETATSPGLVDDALIHTFDIWDQMQQMHDIFTEVESIWTSAAQGQVHLVTATAVTNVAFTQLEAIEHHLIHSCSIKNPSALERAIRPLADHLTPSPGEANSPTFHLIEHLSASWHSMLDLRSQCRASDFELRLQTTRLPSSVAFSPGKELTEKDRKCRALMLSNVALTVVNRNLHNVFVRGGSAGCAEVGWFMAHEKLDPGNCMHCSSALSLLLVSYKAYSFALPPGRSPSGCRVQCLRFAQESMKWIDAVLDDATMPCRCRGTLAFHLENLREDFKSYMRTRLFDVYFQNPWVCGGHILEMMHALRYYGLRLLAYKSYVGSVLHVYNVLRQLGECEQIVVLEDFCIQFEGLFFPGGRPRRAFKNSYVRYLGGRLRFHGSANHQSGCHELAIPAHAARATAGFSTGGKDGVRDPRFDCGKLSVLFRVKERDFYFSKIDVLASNPGNNMDNFSPSSHHQRSDSSRSNTSEESNSTTGTDLSSGDRSGGAAGQISRLKALQAAIEAEFSFPFPDARLNFFALYLDCANAVNEISDQYHDAEAKQGQHCLCFAENLIAAADGGREGKGWRSRKEIKELIDISAGALRKRFGGKRAGDLILETLRP